MNKSKLIFEFLSRKRTISKGQGARIRRYLQQRLELGNCIRYLQSVKDQAPHVLIDVKEVTLSQ